MKLNFKSIQEKRNRMMNDNVVVDNSKQNKNVRRTRTRNLIWTTPNKNIKTRKSGKSIQNSYSNEN